MSDWKSVEDVAKEFGVKLDLAGDEGVRSELRRIMATLHPDKHGGEFASDSDKEKYLRAQKAVEFLDAAKDSLAMIPVSQLPAIVTAVAQALSFQTQNPQVARATVLAEARSYISSRFILPKIGSGLFAGLIGLLVAFSDRFAEHPIIGPFLQNDISQSTLLSLMLMSAIGFACTWVIEQRSQAKAEYLMSEHAMAELYETLANSQRKKISSRHIFDAVRRGHRGFYGVGASSVQMLEQVAAFQTQRLVERGVLTKMNVAALDAWFEIQEPIEDAV